MTIQLYELVGADDRRFNPFCWRTRMALAHKRLDLARTSHGHHGLRRAQAAVRSAG